MEDCAVVAMATLTVTGTPFMVIAAGDQVQVDAGGRVEHPSNTTPLKPLLGVTVTE